MIAPSPLLATMYVAVGGGVGSALRHLAGRSVVQVIGPGAAGAFPWATLSVNVLGSLAMGLLVGFLAREGQGAESWRLLVGVGLLGGFTTFSAFSMEVVLLAQRGAMGLAALYATISLAAGIGALLGGLMLMRTTA